MPIADNLKAVWTWASGTASYPETEALERELRARDLEIEKLRTRLISALEWKTAVHDALVVNWAFKADHEVNPRLAVRDLIAQEVWMALDPAISLEAKKLVEKGAAQTTQNRGLE